MNTTTRLGKPEFSSFTNKDRTVTKRTLYPLLDEMGNVINWMTDEQASSYLSAKRQERS